MITAEDPAPVAGAEGIDDGRRAAVVGLIVAASVATLLTAAVATGSEALTAFDQALTDFTRGWADPLGWPVDLAHAVGLLAGPALSTVYAVGVVVALLVTRYRAAAAFVALSSILGVLATETTKSLMGRARPPGAEQFQSDLDRSFPSGHSSSGIYLYLVVGLVLAHLAHGRRWMEVLGRALIVLGPTIGLSRLVLGVHWPSDIIAGWAFGSCSALLAALLLWEPLARGWAGPAPARVERAPTPTERESLALKLSGAAALVLAVLGVLWGLAVASQVILFDGLYAIIGFGLSWLGLRAAALVEGGPTPHYPFGREALAPLVVAVQALVLLGTFGYACVDAIGVILAGGSETELGPALLYSVLSLAASIVIYLVLVRMQTGSDLVGAEAMQWRASVVLGIAMTLGFSLAWGLTEVGRTSAAPFVDPALVLVAAVLILPAPIALLRGAFRELLEGEPGREVTDPIHDAVAHACTDFGLPQPTERIGKLGRKIYLELDFLVDPDQGWGIDDADRVRRHLMTSLSTPGRLLWINVELHTDPDWDAEISP